MIESTREALLTAEAKFRDGHVDEAVLLLGQASVAVPPEFAAQLHLARALMLFSIGDLAGTLNLLPLVLSDARTHLAGTLLKADCALRNGDSSLASSLLHNALTIEDDTNTRLGLIAALLVQGKVREAQALVSPGSSNACQDVRERFAAGVLRDLATSASATLGHSLVMAGHVDIQPTGGQGLLSFWSAFSPLPGQSDIYALLPAAIDWDFLQITGAPSRLGAPAANTLVVNLLADPDWRRDDLLEFATWLERTDCICINPPRHVLRTARDDVARLLADMPGIHVPRTVRWDPAMTRDPPSLTASQNGITLPLIIRPVGSHTGVGMALVDSLDTLDHATSMGPATAHYLTEYVDCRHADGLYRKTRAYLIGEDCILHHHLVSPDWNIHVSDADVYMRAHPEALQEEDTILANPDQWLGSEDRNCLLAIAKCLGLDYLIVDFSMLEDGRLVLFEANAVCRFTGVERAARIEPMRRAGKSFAKLLMAYGSKF